MTIFKRFALYYAPPAGPLSDFAAAWLGWDALSGRAVPQPTPPGLPRVLPVLTEAPRRYGFHATIKPPFRLAEGQSGQTLHQATAALAETLAPVALDGLMLTNLDGFLALTPLGDPDPLSAFAARVVTALDPLRAPLTEAEMARRLMAPLSPRQRQLLDLWGYPHVMEQFQFHMTLTGHLPVSEAEAVHAVLAPLLAPHLTRPWVIDSLSLFGEAADGQFHHLHRYRLAA